MKLAGLLSLIALSGSLFVAGFVTRDYALFGWGVVALAGVMVAAGAVNE